MIMIKHLSSNLNIPILDSTRELPDIYFSFKLINVHIDAIYLLNFIPSYIFPYNNLPYLHIPYPHRLAQHKQLYFNLNSTGMCEILYLHILNNIMSI